MPFGYACPLMQKGGISLGGGVATGAPLIVLLGGSVALRFVSLHFGADVPDPRPDAGTLLLIV
jgi:hypothetical protein